MFPYYMILQPEVLKKVHQLKEISRERDSQSKAQNNSYTTERKQILKEIYTAYLTSVTSIPTGSFLLQLQQHQQVKLLV